MKTGQAGADRRGLWVDDRLTGTKARLGLVGYDLAEALTLQGNRQAARQALAKPHFGFRFSKEF